MNLRDIPPDSLLHSWLAHWRASEVPFSYQVACGLSCLGSLLRRQRWVDQVNWRVYPNQSVMLIGPSGIGKDTIIDGVTATLGSVPCRTTVLGGATIEGIKARMSQLGRPAAAFIPAPEITEFFGAADYQANMLTGVTNLLSNKDRLDISTKGDLMSNSEGRYIYEPTLTMHAGSTVEWLHKKMPDGTLEGGFLGRFLIVPEEFGSRFIPLVKSHMTLDELASHRGHLAAWYSGLEKLLVECKTPHEVVLFQEAEDMYANWYHNRFKLFSHAVMPYANRSRDMVLRLAMLLAVSRGHTRWIDEDDMGFAISLLAEIAEKIDRVVLPPSVEAQIAGKILEILPAQLSEVYRVLGARYSPQRQIDPALDLLRRTGRITQDGRTIRATGGLD